MTTPMSIAPHAEPLHVDGGRIGVLVSHGFTGSPISVRDWGLDLAARGFTVSVPRLPGHGTSWRDLNTYGWDDWYGTLDAELTALQATCDRVAVCGLSMGGGLGIRLAELRPDDVSALVVVNPAIASNDWRIPLAPVLKRLMPSLPSIGGDVKKPGIDETAYPRTPTRALATQIKMWPTIRRDLGLITSPVLMFRSTDDHVVDGATLAAMQAGITPGVAEYVTLENSYHVATMDYDAPLIFERSAAFITTHVGSPQ